MTCYDVAFQLAGECMLYFRCFLAYAINSLGFDS